MSSTTGATRLRVGVLCHGATIEAWQARCLEALAAVAGADPVVVIVETREGRSRLGRDRAIPLRKDRRQFLLQVREEVDELCQ